MAKVQRDMGGFGAESTGTEVAGRFRGVIWGRTFIITGVSPLSLGSQLATVLAAHSPRLLILASRTLTKIQAVAATISALHPNVTIACIQVDFSSFPSIRKAVMEIEEVLRKENHGIDVIFNNAGINISERHLSPEGGNMEMQFTTNHLGPFLFTNLLIPCLMPAIFSGYQSRIINTSSEAHRLSPIRFSDLNQEPGRVVPRDEEPRKGLPAGVLRVDGRYEPMIAYGMSKCANILMVVGLRKKLVGRGFGFWGVNPDIMTDLPRGLDEQALAGLNKITNWKTHDQGVATLLVAALAPSLKHYMGVYLDDCKIRNPSRWAADEKAAERLWRVSEDIVGLGQGKGSSRL